MTRLSLDTFLKDCDVTVEFYWYGEEPDWESVDVFALLPSAVAPETRHLAKINALLSGDDWIEIEHDIYVNEDKLKRQAEKYEY